MLVSNDDGYDAAGIRALREAILPLGDVFVVAPEKEQSAKSHSLTLHRPLRRRVVSPGVTAIDGTPADCVYAALYHPDLLPRTPDLVVSGINHGPNLATDVHYSGTVAAAREAAVRGIPAIAFSTQAMDLLAENAAMARAMVERYFEAVVPEGAIPLFNVNFPKERPRGIMATRLGLRHYDDAMIVREDPRGGEYLWIGGAEVNHPPMKAADTVATDDGFVSVTPLSIDVTAAELLGMAAWLSGPHSD
ncbi:MAG: 5'/3'-nucleotidase SurE [Myxococcales bacterium]|nr:5'/3'-nucleotidase SurE [Myxococcales bacterium]